MNLNTDCSCKRVFHFLSINVRSLVLIVYDALFICSLDCPNLADVVPNSVVSKAVYSGEAVTITCSSGYTLTGENIFICTSSGNYSSSDYPICNRSMYRDTQTIAYNSTPKTSSRKKFLQPINAPSYI